MAHLTRLTKLLTNSADRDESGGIRRSGNCPRSNQSLKPDVLRDAIGGRNAKRAHELTPIFLIREKSARRFRSFLLQTLEREHASVVSLVRKKTNGSVIFSYRSRPPQTFILWLSRRPKGFCSRNTLALFPTTVSLSRKLSLSWSSVTQGLEPALPMKM